MVYLWFIIIIVTSNPMPQLTISKETYKITKGNIIKMYEQASNEEIAETSKWYSDAQKFTETLSLEFNNQISSIKIAGVIAALSPRNEWNRNKFDAKQICKEFLSNKYYQLNLLVITSYLILKSALFTLTSQKQLRSYYLMIQK